LGGTPTPSNGLSIARNTGATWFLASENEWYKAAYHQPAAQGGDADNYWLYPTASNSEPTHATANSVGDISNPGANVANYDLAAFRDGNVTTVASAGPLSRSFYGTYDQGGNVFEWNESRIINEAGVQRGLRGGSWFELSYALISSDRRTANQVVGSDQIGFRVATVPEPSAIVLAAMAGLCGLAMVARKRYRVASR
jgi:formylglycine-generating enzyme required for sulfatase activity